MAQFRSGFMPGLFFGSSPMELKHQSSKPQASQFACSTLSRQKTRIRTVGRLYEREGMLTPGPGNLGNVMFGFSITVVDFSHCLAYCC